MNTTRTLAHLPVGKRGHRASSSQEGVQPDVFTDTPDHNVSIWGLQAFRDPPRAASVKEGDSLLSSTTAGVILLTLT